VVASPVAWMLRDTRTGKVVTSKAYVRREAAEVGAVNQSGRWKTYEAIPVFALSTPNERKREEEG
jgi:hypothetical protein